MAARPKSNAPSGVEGIKEASNHLRGELAEQLHNQHDYFDESGKQLLKFHGLYQQDDRDQRKAVRGSEKTHSFMLRTRVPGGLLTAEQYLAHDDLSQGYANGTLRITTRQCFQFHGLLKGDLQATIRVLNDALITSLGACGDVVRNVCCCPAPHHDAIRTQIQAVTREMSDHLLPRTRAYHELWIDGEKVDLDAPPLPEGEPVEPIYGKTYLPRKFKIAVAYPGDNCVDVFTQDVGLVAIVEAGELLGFNLIAGGGMGMNHTKADTFPRLGDLIGFVTPAQVAYAVWVIRVTFCSLVISVRCSISVISFLILSPMPIATPLFVRPNVCLKRPADGMSAGMMGWTSPRISASNYQPASRVAGVGT